ncbi:MAG: cytochrome c oxidase accessory protein CcoG [Myxococcales bacterium]|nr:cytochrome c oxidase accessory protein CcoG [Myxococcales bacterium]
MSSSIVPPTQERPTTISEGGARQWLYPASFKGKWLNRRTVVNVIFLILFFGLPWLEVGDHQAVLLDLPKRKLAFFGLVLWPQDSYLLWLLLFTGLLGIFIITAQWGRLWCGWACPQTVFMEGVFRHIENKIEGKPAKRLKRDQGPLTWDKIWRKTLKHSVFFFISAHVANTALCYLASSERVMDMTLTNPSVNSGWFGLMFGVTMIFYLDFAWFREQLCTIACPYGRWQSVLLDDHSLIVGYDHRRGESRGGKGKRRKAPEKDWGDCVDCGLCVQVCPTGIDIRNGLQMECINCTACMDACDPVMEKIGKPTGLIRYTSLQELAGGERKAVRPRIIIYAIFLVVALSVFAYAGTHRKITEVTVVRAQGQAVMQIDGDHLVNHFRAKLLNKSEKPVKIKLESTKGYQFVVPMNPWPVAAGQTATMEIFIRRKLSDFKPGGDDRPLLVFTHDGDEVGRAHVPLLGPGTAGGGAGKAANSSEGSK